MTNPRSWIFTIAAICVFAVSSAVAFVSMGRWFDPFDDRQFVSAEWKSATPEGRALMARDAIRGHLRLGMTKAGVEQLLGPGQEQLRIQGVDPYGNPMPGDHTWYYHLGSWSSYGLDDAFLYVHFDAKGHVISVQIDGG